MNPNNGYTPMHWVSTHHGEPYVEFLEALLERGGEVCIPDHEGRIPLDMFVFEDDDDAAALLSRFTGSLRSPIRFDGTPWGVSEEQMQQFRLWRAVIADHPEGVEKALAEGASPNMPLGTDEIIACVYACAGKKAPGESGGGAYANYVIFRALDKPAILRRLLAAGARTDVLGYPEGYAPLHALAAHRVERPTAAAAVLLDAGAEVDMPDREGRTPLHTACKFKSDGALITLLLRRGASVEREDAAGQNALAHALSDKGKGNDRWIADAYSRNDNDKFIRRLFAAYEEPWSKKDAVRVFGAKKPETIP